MLIPKRKQPGFFCLLLSPLHILLMVTFPKLRKIPARRKDASRNSGKSQRDGKKLPETPENLSATERNFPKLRKIYARRAETFASLQKLQRDARRLLYLYKSFSATGKAFICIKNGLPANLYSKGSFLPSGRSHSQDLSSASVESDGQLPDLLLRYINIRHRRLPVIYNLKLRPGYD